MTGVYHKITQSLENNLDSFSFDEMNYLDDDFESIPSLLCHNEYLEPKTLCMLTIYDHFFFAVLVTIIVILVLCYFLRLLRRQQ